MRLDLSTLAPQDRLMFRGQEVAALASAGAVLWRRDPGVLIGGSSGLWLDALRSASYLDLAGTQPAVPGEPCALVLDGRVVTAGASNLLSNGDFAAGTTGWTPGGAVDQAEIGGELRVTGAPEGVAGALGAYQMVAGLVVGETYRLTARLRCGTAPNVRVRITNGGDLGSAAAETPQVTTGTMTAVSVVFKATATSHGVYLRVGAAGSTGVFDDLRLVPARAATQSDPAARPLLQRDEALRPFWRIDGINDVLRSDVLTLGPAGRTIMAAIRKRADTVQGAVVETAPLWADQPGGFALFAPGGNGQATYGGRSRASGVQSLLNTPTSYPAGAPAVVTMTASGATHELEVNGTVAATGVEAGPMQSWTGALTIGSRDGTAFFAALDLYALLVVDRVLSSTERSFARRWMAARCGAVLA